MSKILRVIDPFFVLEVGDTLTISEDGKFYTFERNEEFHKAGDTDDLNSTYSSNFSISLNYAKELIKDGYLEEVSDLKTSKGSFVNVFDEIDNLLNRYHKELDNIDLDMAGQPQCVKVEKTTVLTNILSVLDHLKTLRK